VGVSYVVEIGPCLSSDALIPARIRNESVGSFSEVCAVAFRFSGSDGTVFVPFDGDSE
jgi:hypothetical protein